MNALKCVASYLEKSGAGYSHVHIYTHSYVKCKEVWRTCGVHVLAIGVGFDEMNQGSLKGMFYKKIP